MGTIVIIWAKPCQIECFRSDQKCENHYQIKHVRFSTGTKFHIEQTILIFWAKFVLKRYFRSKIEKVNTTIEFSIFTLIQVPNVILKRQFWFKIITQGKDSFANLIAWTNLIANSINFFLRCDVVLEDILSMIAMYRYIS